MRGHVPGRQSRANSTATKLIHCLIFKQCSLCSWINGLIVFSKGIVQIHWVDKEPLITIQVPCNMAQEEKVGISFPSENFPNDFITRKHNLCALSKLVNTTTSQFVYETTWTVHMFCWTCKVLSIKLLSRFSEKKFWQLALADKICPARCAWYCGVFSFSGFIWPGWFLIGGPLRHSRRIWRPVCQAHALSLQHFRTNESTSVFPSIVARRRRVT